MKVSLLHAGEVLGVADLEEAPGLHRPDRPVLSGPFQPTPAFESIASLFAEKQRIGREFFAASSPHLSKGMTPEQVREALLASIPATLIAEFSDIEREIDALGLEVRNVNEELVAGHAIDVSRWRLFDALSLPQEQVRATERQLAAEGIATSGYTLTLARRRAS